MRYRKLDANGDYVFGGSQQAFLIDTPDTVAQAVSTRLQLQFGEWFLDVTDGTDWKTKVLGKYTANVRDETLRIRILGTPGVTSIISYSSTFDHETRTFSVITEIDTVYGSASVSESI